ncbi:trehalose-phosphatase [Rhodococcus aerolatus]
MTDRDDVRRALVADPGRAGLVLDFDGVLSPIVDDPASSTLPDGTAELLASLARRLGLVALLSGRPADFLAARAGVAGVVLLGSYGVQEHRDGATTLLPAVARWVPVVAGARAALEAGVAGLPGVLVEDKELAVAVHWRRSPDPGTAGRAVADLVAAVAGTTGLAVEPGKLVLELRPPVGEDKGTALRRLAAAHDLQVVAYAGDDRGDLPAFAAVAELGGHALVVEGPGTDPEVAAVAGPHLDGPDDVAGRLRELVAAVDAAG